MSDCFTIRPDERVSEPPAADLARGTVASHRRAGRAPSPAPRPPAARRVRRRAHRRRHPSRSVGRQPDRHRSGAAQGVHVDDRARARDRTASTRTTPVVVYDEQSGVRAARAFWFLEYFGHPSVRLLDGGFGAWTRAGLPVTRDAGRRRRASGQGTREAQTLATWQRRARRDRPAGRRDPRHAQRRRVLRHDGARGARRRHSRRRPHRMDAQPRPRTATSSRPPS